MTLSIGSIFGGQHKPSRNAPVFDDNREGLDSSAHLRCRKPGAASDPLDGLGVYDFQTFQRGYFAERLIRYYEMVHKALRGNVECNRELERVQSAQAIGKSIPADLAFRSHKSDLPLR
jgi:hypothetical protein